jgi:hypothetical protein
MTSVVSLLVAAIAIFLLLFAINAPQGRTAAVETVTNKNDSGAGSLRQAIGDANAGGTVKFKAGLKGTILLETPLEIDKDLTIQGPGSAVITLSGGGDSQIMLIGSNTGDSSVSISGLTFTKGSFRGNCAPAGGLPPCDAGAITATDVSSLRVTDSVFRMNATSDEGGAVLIGGDQVENDGSATFIRNTFIRNSGQNGGGGIVMAATGAFTLRDSEFVNNSADGNGGGAVLVEPYFDSGNLPDYGGAITITGNEFTANGGSADADGPTVRFNRWSGPATVDESLFSGSGADEDGGGIYTEAARELTVTDSLFFNLYNDGSGSGISNDASWDTEYGEPPADWSRTVIERTDFIDNSSERHGAVWMSPNVCTNGSPPSDWHPLDLTIRDVDFDGNFSYASSEASALSVDASTCGDDGVEVKGEVLIERTDFNKNIGGEGGMAIDFDSGFPNDSTVRNVSIVNGLAGDSFPAAWEFSDGYYGDCETAPPGPDCVRSTTTATNVTVAGNGSAQSSNGAVKVNSANQVKFESSTIALNVTTQSGGTDSNAGLYVDGLAELENTIVAENVGAGSGVTGQDCFVGSDGSLTLTGVNLIGDLGTRCAFTGDTPLTGDPKLALDPVRAKRVGGGTTWVVPLLKGSRAIDASEGGSPSKDQRGVPRPQFSAPDLGAFELAPKPSAKLKGGAGLESAQVQVSCGSGRACKLRISGLRNLAARTNDPVTETITVSLKGGQKKTVTLPYTQALVNSVLRARREGRKPILHIELVNVGTTMTTKLREAVTAPTGPRKGPRRPVNTGG